MRSRLSQLSCVMAVAEEGQIARAARRLNSTEASVSRSLARLESELGVELFVRGPRGTVLTSAGAAFLDKARAAFAAEAEAVEVGAALQRAARRTLLVGFVGPPPTLTFPALFERFAAADAACRLSFQDLPFPRGTTASWLAGVDVALCHRPREEPGVCTLPVRVEARALVARAEHPLAGRETVGVAEVLEETFIGFDAGVQPEWAAFHSLDDHRGGPPAAVTADDVTSSLQMAATLSSSTAVTTVPDGDIRAVHMMFADVVAVPLEDAAPAVVSLVWREDRINPLLEHLLEAARELGTGGDGL